VDRARIQARDRREDSNNLELSLIRRQEYNFTDEHLARTEALQTKVGRVPFDQMLRHIREDKCEQCRAVVRYFDREAALELYLRQSRN